MNLGSTLPWLQQGLTDASIGMLVLYGVVMTQLTILSVTLYLHRHSAHRALDLHPALKHFFRFWLWLTTGMVTKEWTAVHRKHHAHVETESDPHSPQIHGIATLLFRGAALYRRGADDPETVQRYGKGTPDDWLERHVYTPLKRLGIVLMLLINLVLFGLPGLIIWGVQMLWIPLMAAGVINGIGHYWGYRNFECPDASTNIVPWGLIIGGEELHNNHHTYPNSAKFSAKRWEIDLGWLWIRLLSMLRLAKPLSTGPLVARDSEPREIDGDTVWAVLNDRFRVMARFGEKVVAPLAKYERRRADPTTRRLLKRARSLLCREERLVRAEEYAQLSRMLRISPVLGQIYELRQQLRQVCARRGADRDELIRAFRQWCRDAEATGIQVVKDFVEELRSYRMPTMAG